MALKRTWISFALAGASLFSMSILAIVVVFGVLAASSYSAYSNSGRVQSYEQPRMGGMDDTDRGGQLIFEIDGQLAPSPALKTDYDVDIQGDLVHVSVTQSFENPTDSQINALYEFPLNSGAAVHDMTMIIGSRRIRSEIKEKEEAKQVYEAAKEEGKQASLLVQQRPNVFTQHVANIGPRESIEIQIDYVHTVRKFEGKYELTLPLVVGPRFNPADLSANTLGGEQAPLVTGSTEHPSMVTGSAQDPSTIDSDRVGIRVRIDSALALNKVASPSHNVVSRRLGSGDWSVALAETRVLDNRHFELVWDYAAADTTVGAMSSWNPELKQGHASILIEAPRQAPAHVMQREMVFLLDCSGSMYGAPMNASKAFMRKALNNLRPTDTFRIIRFSDAATEFSTKPMLATRGNLEVGLAYVEQLEGSGGTMMSSGIKQALDVPGDPNTLRLVTFLTDGYIGNDFEILSLIDERIGNSRLYAIGVGTGVNTYLLDEVGRTGRGFTRYIDPTEDVEHAATELAERLQSPVLTDIEVEWHGQVTDVYPAKIPDLFAGQSVRLMGTYKQPGKVIATISGNAGGERIQMPVVIELTGTNTRGMALQQTWARARVKALMNDLTSNPERRTFDMDDEALRTAVTHMGLEYRLMTQWTSFVAVADTATSPAAEDTHRFQNAPVEGVSMGFVSGAPEPGTIGGLLLMGIGALAGRRRKKKEGYNKS